jgi:hypothetical protein
MGGYEMKCYLILPKRDVAHADSYWVLAESSMQARQLVAQNVPGASGIKDEREFECVLNDQKRPPLGVIYTHISGAYSASNGNQKSL